MFEADSLRDCAFELEMAGKGNDMAAAGHLISRLEKEYRTFISDPAVSSFVTDTKAV